MQNFVPQKTNSLYQNVIPHRNPHEEFQMEPQIINVTGTSGAIQCDLSTLNPHFNNLNVPAKPKTLCKIVRASFPHSILNLKSTDALELGCQLIYFRNNNYTTILNNADAYETISLGRGSDPLVGGVQFNFDNDPIAESVTAHQLIHRLQQNITTRFLTLQENVGAQTESQAIFALIFKACKFEFDEHACKLRLVFDANHSNNQPTVANTTFIQNNATLVSVYLELRPSRHMSLEDQQRVASLFGIARQYSLYNGAPPQLGQTPLYFTLFHITTNETRNAQQGNIYEMHNNLVEKYGDKPIRTFYPLNIHVNTTLNTSIWNSENSKKTRSLAIIKGPRLICHTACTQLVQEYPSYRTEIEAQTSKTFQILVQDDQGNNIHFYEPYQIQIAIYFK